MSQQTLFDTAPLVPAYCPIQGCQAMKLPTDPVAPACMVDAKRILGQTAWRPAKCLNGHNPQTAPFPEGY